MSINHILEQKPGMITIERVLDPRDRPEDDACLLPVVKATANTINDH